MPHFLGYSKKDVVGIAVCEDIGNHRDEINEDVRAALTQLDGSVAAAVSLLSGFDAGKLAELGGFGSGAYLTKADGIGIWVMSFLSPPARRCRSAGPW
jgi:hypothetical protein